MDLIDQLKELALRISKVKKTKRIIFVASLLCFTSLAHAETVIQLNALFSTSGSDVQEMPGSYGQLLISSDAKTAIRKISTCFTSGFCGPEIQRNQIITEVKEGKVFLNDSSTGVDSNETILFSDKDRTILLKTIMFTDSITIEDWGIRANSNVVNEYSLTDLYANANGFIFKATGSTGHLTVASDGRSVKRNLMICIDGCEMPTSRDFDLTIVPGKTVFFTDKLSGAVIENLIIAAEHDLLILLEKNPSGGEYISIWKPN